jgi:PAS domain S-box-containing protein
MVYEQTMDNNLQANTQIFFDCVEKCSEPVMLSDAFGQLTYVNPAWTRVYGYSKEEALGKTPRLLRSKFQSDAFYLDMWKQIRDPKVGYWRGEMVNQAKDGHFVPVLLTITPFKDPLKKTNEVEGYMGIAIDLTAQKSMEVKAMQQDRLASAGLVASGLAHEIGTPLGVIRGRAEFLLMEVENNDSLRSGLDVIIAQIDRVSKLIQTFLKASRPPKDVEVSCVSLLPIVQDVLALASQHARKLGIEICIQIEPSTSVWADANQLHQVFLNLFINAVHAIEKQKESGDNSDKVHQIKIQSNTTEDRVSILITDTGCGMSEDILSKIFHPFFTTKDVGKGTGLGLAISSQIVAELKGTIKASSLGPGMGSTFIVSLPRYHL